MNLGTALKSKLVRQQPGNADPAHAYGSEEQLMAEFQRQEYVQPVRRPGVLSGIRERLSGSPARSYETDAPVYSADSYSRESAPDLGWEAAFDPEAAARPAQSYETTPREAPEAASAAERFEQFRQTVYSSPVRPAPVYEEITFGEQPRRENRYSQPVYEEITFGGQTRRAPAAAPAPIYEDLTPGPRPTAAETGPYGGAEPPREPSSAGPAPGPYEPSPAPQRAARGSDLPYAFWSGSIVAGVALTLFAFVYACVM